MVVLLRMQDVWYSQDSLYCILVQRNPKLPKRDARRACLFCLVLRKCGHPSSVTLALSLRVMDSLFPCYPEREKTIADTNCVRLREAQREES